MACTPSTTRLTPSLAASEIARKPEAQDPLQEANDHSGASGRGRIGSIGILGSRATWRLRNRLLTAGAWRRREKGARCPSSCIR